MKYPLATKAAKGRSVPVSAEMLVNMYAEAAPDGARNAVTAIGCPGLELFGTSPEDNIRGVYYVAGDGSLWVVAGLVLYKVASDGVFASVGTIGGYGRVSMADNGVELIIVTEAISYVVTLASDTLTAITDSDYPNADTVAALGGYFFFNNNQSGSRGQMFWSGAYDGSAYDALDFATAENASDNLVAVHRDHDRLLLFGTHTIESWFLTGDTDIVAPYKGGAINYGLGARWSRANLSNSVFFLDDSGIVRAIAGQGGSVAQRISTHAIENQIAKGAWRHDDAAAYDGAVASSYVEEGHEFYCLTVPGTGTFVFDAITGLWHQRKSRFLEHSRASFHVQAFNKVLCADIHTGGLYEQSLDYAHENGEYLIAEIQMPELHNNGDRFIVNKLQLFMETGLAGSISTSSGEAVALGFGDAAWTQQNDGFVYNYREVGYGNGVFIITGLLGHIIRSADNGVTWTEPASGVTEDMFDAGYYDGVWIVAGRNGWVTRSTDDGATWTATDLGAIDYYAGGINTSTGTRLIAGDGAATDASRSTDNGLTWTDYDVGAGVSEVYWVAHGGPQWILVGQSGMVRRSYDDAVTWSDLTAASSLTGTTQLNSIQYNAGTWIIVGNIGFMLRSDDEGETWATVTSSFGTTNIREIGYGLGFWFAVGGDGKIASSIDDGVTWTQVASTSYAASDTIDSIVYGNETFVTCSQSGKVATLAATQLEYDAGSGLTATAFNDDPQITLDVLSDGSRNRDVTQKNGTIGKIGEYKKRIIWRRLGQHRSFTPKFTISDPVRRVVFDATVEIAPNDS